MQVAVPMQAERPVKGLPYTPENTHSNQPSCGWRHPYFNPPPPYKHVSFECKHVRSIFHPIVRLSPAKSSKPCSKESRFACIRITAVAPLNGAASLSTDSCMQPQHAWMSAMCVPTAFRSLREHPAGHHVPASQTNNPLQEKTLSTL